MRKKTKNCRAFSLIEVIIAMGIFTIIILATVSTFASVVKARKSTREVQKNLEAARSVMEIWSKNTRMSRYVDTDNGTQNDQVMKMYNNSQENCIAYRFLTGGGLEMAQFSVAVANAETDCALVTNYDAHWQTLIPGVSGEFKVVKSEYTSPKSIGRSTVHLLIGKETLQTSTSFREYQGLIN
jgi:prepilin-type N-terminal cleavage/methylation domain-containing protein